jgi:hypothetical protein
VILENATVRAAAVSALARFGAAVEDLRPRVVVLLKRALYDNDDEVRGVGQGRGVGAGSLVKPREARAPGAAPCCRPSLFGGRAAGGPRRSQGPRSVTNMECAPLILLPLTPQVRDRATLHLAQLAGHLGGPEALLQVAQRRVSLRAARRRASARRRAVQQ